MVLGSSLLTAVGASLLEVGVHWFILQAVHLLMQDRFEGYFEFCQTALQDRLISERNM